MPLTCQWVRTGAEPALGYLCYPDRARTPLPAVLVLQEAWGVEEHIEDVTRRFAAAGYAAFAPDLYARGGERPPALTRARMSEMLAFLATLPPTAMMDPKALAAALTLRPEDEQERIRATRGAIFGDGQQPGLLRPDVWLPQLLGATHFLRHECAVTRGSKVAAVGFCMGGGLTALLACHDEELAAAAVFYGVAPAAELVPAIACPVLGLYGALDARINAGVPAFAEAMARHGKRFEPHTYEGAGHSFFNDTRPSYEVRAARDAFARVLGLFRETLAT